MQEEAGGRGKFILVEDVCKNREAVEESCVGIYSFVCMPILYILSYLLFEYSSL